LLVEVEDEDDEPVLEALAEESAEPVPVGVAEELVEPVPEGAEVDIPDGVEVNVTPTERQISWAVLSELVRSLPVQLA